MFSLHLLFAYLDYLAVPAYVTIDYQLLCQLLVLEDGAVVYLCSRHCETTSPPDDMCHLQNVTRSPGNPLVSGPTAMELMSA
jgi:hypothetical protein